MAQRVENAHSGEINAVSFSPGNEFLFASGSSDGTVALWDTRKLTSKVHSLEVPTEDSARGQVTSVKWHPTVETLLASSGTDRRVNIWDLSRIGMEQDHEDAQDGMFLMLI